MLYKKKLKLISNDVWHKHTKFLKLHLYLNNKAYFV